MDVKHSIRGEYAGFQQEDNYRDLLTWITTGGLRYAYAKLNHVSDNEAYFHTKVPTSKVRDVVVVGAGIAGLVAGFELSQVGHNVTIIEARDRAGGRIKTIREGFADGIYCEGGPMRIPQQHFLVRHYIDLFGLQTQTAQPATSDPYRYLHGDRLRQSEWKSRTKEYCDKFWPGWDSHLPVDHSVQGIGDLYERTTAPVVADLFKLGTSPTEQQWQTWIEKWSQLTMLDFLQSDLYQEKDAGILRPWPEAAITAFKEADYTPTIERDVVWFLRRKIGKWADYPMFSITGGSDRLPQAFLSRNIHGWNQNVELQRCVVYGTKVEKIESADRTDQRSRLRIGCRNVTTGRECVYEADAVILTAPLPTLHQINIPWSDKVHKILAGIKTWSATKLFLQCRTRFWEKDVGVGGRTVTDLQLGELYYPSHKGKSDSHTDKSDSHTDKSDSHTDKSDSHTDKSDGHTDKSDCHTDKSDSHTDKSDSHRGVLLAYTWKQAADKFGTMTEKEALKLVIEQISTLHPEIGEEFESGRVQAWGQEEYTRCGTTSLGSLDYLQRLETLTMPTAGLPIYVAGDSLSWANGWLQGAIFSGLTQAYCLQCNIENGSVVSPVTLIR